MSESFEKPDSFFVKKYIAGDEYSLELLINRHEQRIFNFIYSKVFDYDITNDIFQDTFIKVIRNLKLKKYNEEGKFLPWVMRIAHNLIIDHFRKNKRMPKFDNSGDFDIFSVIEDTSLNKESELIKEQIEGSLVNLIKELPEDQIEVLQMRIYKEMSFKEIAEQTDVSINTALGRMRYALINLRKLVEEKNIILTRE
jgi:RNA polymerase sigma-70 factor (ECF subfamily)